MGSPWGPKAFGSDGGFVCALGSCGSFGRRSRHRRRPSGSAFTVVCVCVHVLFVSVHVFVLFLLFFVFDSLLFGFVPFSFLFFLFRFFFVPVSVFVCLRPVLPDRVAHVPNFSCFSPFVLPCRRSNHQAYLTRFVVHGWWIPMLMVYRVVMVAFETISVLNVLYQRPVPQKVSDVFAGAIGFPVGDRLAQDRGDRRSPQYTQLFGGIDRLFFEGASRHPSGQGIVQGCEGILSFDVFSGSKWPGDRIIRSFLGSSQCLRFSAEEYSGSFAMGSRTHLPGLR